MKYLFLTAFLLQSYFMMAQNAQEFANVNRYAAANDQLENATADRVVFMGDSITEGWQRVDPDFFTNNNFICRGISGQTTSQMLLRFRADVIDLKPKAVVILAGINDIAQNTGPIELTAIAGNIKSMSELAKANGIKVYISSVLPANRFPWRQEIKPAQLVKELNTMLKDFAMENKIEYVDYYKEMVDKEFGLSKDDANDGVHPTDSAYQQMEQIVLKSLK